MRTPVGVAMTALVALASLQAFAPRETPPLAASQIPVQLMHFNSVVQSKAALVAAGELGYVLFSRDKGQTWLRASVDKERQALINQISFASDGLTGLAVGHEGWILRTEDGGLSWREIAFEEKNGEPLMSVAQVPSGQWIAVGAFGRALISDAKARNWSRLPLPAEVEDKHMNRIAGSTDRRSWLIVGERGLVLQSEDGAASWRLLPAFYNGSFYGAAQLKDGAWLAYGMRGNAYRSGDDGKSWTKAEIAAPVSFFGHTQTSEGQLLLGGQGGMLAISKDGGQSFALQRSGKRGTLTELTGLEGSPGVWMSSTVGIHALAPAASDLSPSQKTNAGAAR